MTYSLKRLLKVSLLSFIIAVLLISEHTHAIDEQFYSSNDILYYNPDATCATGGSSGETVSTEGVTLSGTDNIEKAFNFMKGKGLSDDQAAGIVGNFIQESGVDPENIQNPGGRSKNPRDAGSAGWGLIQWTPASKVLDAAKGAGVQDKPIHELSTQLEIVWGHMNNKPPITTGKFSVEQFKKIDDIRGAVQYFETNIEGAGDPQIDKRVRYATKVKQDFGGGGDVAAESAPTVSNDPGTSGCNSSSSDQSSSATGSVDSDIGVGKGKFKDSGEVKNWSIILNNAKIADEATAGKLVGRNRCATIVGRVWRNANLRYGYESASDVWYEFPGIRHADRNPKKGAILLYAGTTNGHVTIYLGNNKVLNDAKITDAKNVEGWGGGYVGWIDPNEIGWKTSMGTKQSILNAIKGDAESASYL